MSRNDSRNMIIPFHCMTIPFRCSTSVTFLLIHIHIQCNHASNQAHEPLQESLVKEDNPA